MSATRCSRCSTELSTPAEFTARLCEACLLGEAFNPLALAPDAFLRALLDIARPSMDGATYREARLKLDLILGSVFKAPVTFAVGASTTLQAAVAARVRPECPACRGIGCKDCRVTTTGTKAPTDTQWKASQFSVSETQ